jgi:hypothetical protein
VKPNSGSTAIMLCWPSVKTQRIVPRAAALADPRQGDRGLSDRRPHLPYDQMHEHEPALALRVVLHLGQEEPAARGHHDRARVGQP